MVILFGSRARGDFGKESDWDLLILTSIPATEENKRIFRYHLLDIELETEQAISTLNTIKIIGKDILLLHFIVLLKKKVSKYEL